MKRLQNTLLSIVFLIVCAAAFADSHQTDNLADLDIDQLMDLQVESVSGASRYAQKVTEAPAFITVVTADEIAKYGYRTVADILKSVTGFYVTYDRLYSSLGVRGFGQPGNLSNRVQILIDGKRFNDIIYDAAPIDLDFILDVDLIERVEIIRGPGSSLYGSNAFFAVVNVISKKGSDYEGFEFSVERGSFDYDKQRGTWGKTFDCGLEALLSYTNFNSSGQDFYFREYAGDPVHNNGIFNDGDEERGFSSFIKLTYEGLTAQGGYVTRRKHFPTGAYDTVINDNRSQGTDKVWFADLMYEHEFENLFDFMGRIFYQQDHFNGDYTYDDAGDVVVNHDTARDYWWGGEIQFSKAIGKNHKLIWGGEVVINGRQDQANFDIYGDYLDDKQESERWAVYIQDEFDVTDKLKIIAGLRRDDYSQFGHTANPRFAAIYSISDTKIKALYGQAFRAPTPYELYYNDDGDTQKANPDLTPEEIKTYELILQQHIAKGFWATFTGFCYEIENLIELAEDPGDNLLVHNNSGGAKAQGFEFELTGKTESGWNVRTGYTYVNTKDIDTSARLVNSPKHLGKVNVIAPLYEKKVFAGFEVQYTHDRKTMGGSTTNDFFATNLTIFSEDIIKNLDFSLSIYNLCDSKFQDPMSDELTQDKLTQNGRTYAIQLTYRF